MSFTCVYIYIYTYIYIYIFFFSFLTVREPPHRPHSLAGLHLHCRSCNVSYIHIFHFGLRDKSVRLSGRRHFSLCLMVFSQCKLKHFPPSHSARRSVIPWKVSFHLTSPASVFALPFPVFGGSWVPVPLMSKRALVAPEPPETFGRPPSNARRSSLYTEYLFPFGCLRIKEPFTFGCFGLRFRLVGVGSPGLWAGSRVFV